MKAPQFSKLADFSTLGDDELRALAERYPFFAGVHEALAHRHRDGDNWLNKAALRANNREQLRELLQQEYAVIPPVIKTWVADTVTDNAAPTQPEQTEAQTVATENQSEFYTEEQATVALLDEPAAITATDEGKIAPKEHSVESEVELTESIVPVTSNYKIQEESIASTLIDDTLVTDFTISISEPQVSKNVIAEEGEKPEVQSDPVVLNQPRSFDDWLTVFSSQRHVTVEFPENTLQSTADDEINRLIATNAAAEFFTESLRQETHYTRDLDRFIEDQKMRAAHKQQAQSGPLITETLAKIYEKQGLTDKAIAAYEQLSLKFPEKKAFFALHIEKLKEK